MVLHSEELFIKVCGQSQHNQVVAFKSIINSRDNIFLSRYVPKYQCNYCNSLFCSFPVCRIFSMTLKKRRILFYEVLIISGPVWWCSRQLVRLNNMPVMGSSPETIGYKHTFITSCLHLDKGLHCFYKCKLIDGIQALVIPQLDLSS